MNITSFRRSIQEYYGTAMLTGIVPAVNGPFPGVPGIKAAVKEKENPAGKVLPDREAWCSSV
jgi:hypothetical protein